MGVKYFTTSFSKTGQQEFLRMDFGYRQFFDINNAISYKTTLKQFPLNKILKPINGGKVSKGELENEEVLVDMGNVERRMNNLVDLELVNEISSDKNILQDGDIVVPKLQPRMGNIFLNTSHERYIASTEFVEYKITNQNPIFLYYILSSKTISSSLGLLESGKTHRRVSPKDLLKVKIPYVSIEQQNEIIKSIQPIELKIKQLKSLIKPVQNFINEVFSKELSFDISKYNSLKNKRTWNRQISEISTDLIRFTSIQLSPSSKFLQDFLSKEDTSYLNDFLIQDIKRGTQPIYVEEGIPVVKTKDIQGGKVIDENFEYVPEDFFEQKREKEILKYDILLTSTGMGRGKFALYDYDEKAIADSHVSIIRFDRNKINYKFLNFYLQSFFGTGQLKYIEMQTKGTPEIYEQQLKYLKIINVSKEKQERIVEEIQAEIDKQDKIRKEIQQERNRIDEIIESVVLSN